MEYASFCRDAAECFCKPLWQEIDYLVRYRSNIKKLEDQAKKLNPVVVDVKFAVDEAQKHGERIKEQVQNWLERATEAQNLNNEIQANQNHRCFSTCCTPNWRSRYNLSKQAVSIAKEMGVIYGEKNFEGVSLPVPVSPPISKPTAPAPVGHFMSFESTTLAKEDVLKALKHDNSNNNNNNNNKIVGIHGMGGVGKTTMVKQVAEKVMSEGLFDRVVMATVSQAVELRKIQDSIAEGLELKWEEWDKASEEGRAKKLKEKIMADERILVILDDIWEWIDLSRVGIPFGSDLEACKSKILLTTRREHVCHIMGCKTTSRIHLNILSPKDSWNLFVKTAGTIFDSPEFEDVAQQVVRECQGLPLALETVAKALGDKDMEEWKKAARRLQMPAPANPDHEYNKVIECIRMSYDFLKDPKAKALFLICCLLPEDHNIRKEVLARYGMGLGLFQNVETLEQARGDADTYIKNLIDSGLLLKSDEDGCVKMHDVVRDTAIIITSSEDEQLFYGDSKWFFMAKAGSGLQQWPRDRDNCFERYTAISIMFNNIEILPNGPVCPNLQTFLLGKSRNLREIPIGFFNSMKALKVLDISNLSVKRLSPSIGLLKNLCTLYMDRCISIKDISILGALKKLQILSLKYSFIHTFPEELAELIELRLLDMTGCYIQIISPNIISRLHSLEELYLEESFCKWGDRVEPMSEKRNASFEEVINLPKLKILKVDIENVNCLPQNVKFIPKWEKFFIYISPSIYSNQMRHLLYSVRVHAKILLIDTTMSTLPEWFVEAVTEKAEMLIYYGCWKLNNILIEYDKGRLFGLKSLIVRNSNSGQCLIPLADGISKNRVFENLQELHIYNMQSMKEICIGQVPLGCFEKLKILEVQWCSYLENSLLNSNIIQRLNNLEKLHVKENSIKEVFGFEGLQEGRGYLERLKEVRLDKLSQLTNIWKGPAKLADFRNLKTVIVVECNKLKYFFSPSMSQGLLQLEELWVEDCFDLDEIIQKDDEITVDKITLPRLKTLALQNLAHLVNFYDGNSSLECPFLEYLHVRDCPKFRTSDFHSSKQVHFNNEGHYNLLKKRFVEDGEKQMIFQLPWKRDDTG